jgi:hypothetical protein
LNDPLNELTGVEKGPQLYSHVAQGLNVPQGYASAFRSLRPRWMAFWNILHRSCGFNLKAEHDRRDYTENLIFNS